MFEALMVPLLVPEARWGPRSWGSTTRCTSAPRSSTAWSRPATATGGFSPPNNPSGGYREYGVDAIGLNADGSASNNDNTLVDYGFGDCRAALANLARLRRDFDVYGEGGFYDAVNVDTGQVSRFWLALDQGMVMAALGNELAGDRPLLAREEFTAGG
jgi:Putative glucoamylase